MTKKDETTVEPREIVNKIPIFCAFDELAQIEKVTPNPRNPNNHPEESVKTLSKLIKAHGFRAPVTVSKRSGFVVRGHGRLMAAGKLKMGKVPVDYQEYENEAAEWADLIADNKVAEFSAFDLPKLRDIFEELDTGEMNLEDTGFDAEEVEFLMTAIAVEDQSEDEDTRSNRQATAQGIQIIAIGKMAGKCKAAAVEALVARIKARAQTEDEEEAIQWFCNWLAEEAAL